MIDILTSSLQQALLFMPLTLGIYISYRVLRVTDLTVEASFVLGAAVFAKVITSFGAGHESLAVLLALIAGGLAGFGVAAMQLVAKIDSLIASIIAVFMLFSVNFSVMGVPNINLLNTNTFIQSLQDSNPVLAWAYIAVLIVALSLMVCFVLHRKLGLLLRAYGDNKTLLIRLGRKSYLYLIIGLVASNLLSGFSGLLTAQIDGYADLNMGLGTALTAIGSLIVGLKLASRANASSFNAYYDAAAGFLGVLVYFILMNLLLYIGVNPVYLKFILGLLLVVFLSGANKVKGGYNAQLA